MSGYGKRTRAEMWSEIERLKEENEKITSEFKTQLHYTAQENGRLARELQAANKKVDSLLVALSDTTKDYERKLKAVKSELGCKVKDLNDYINNSNKSNNKVTFRQFRKILKPQNADKINFYNKNLEYIFTTTEFGFTTYFTDASRNAIDDFEVIEFRPRFENDNVILDVIIDVK